MYVKLTKKAIIIILSLITVITTAFCFGCNSNKTGEIPSQPVVEVIGGDDDILSVTHNDRSFSVYRPFVFYLPHTPGLNVLSVKNGNEEQSVIFTVSP